MTGQSKDHPQVRRRQADDQTLRPEAEGERGKGQEEGRGRKEEGGEEEGVSLTSSLPFLFRAGYKSVIWVVG